MDKQTKDILDHMLRGFVSWIGPECASVARGHFDKSRALLDATPEQPQPTSDGSTYKLVVCSSCNGTGIYGPEPCATCDSTGFVEDSEHDATEQPQPAGEFPRVWVEFDNAEDSDGSDAVAIGNVFFADDPLRKAGDSHEYVHISELEAAQRYIAELESRDTKLERLLEAARKLVEALEKTAEVTDGAR